MGDVIPFPQKPDSSDEELAVDLLTAVDAAIRDLREISRRWGDDSARRQAEECRLMLERAFDEAICNG
jgi:hypothetical protein